MANLTYRGITKVTESLLANSGVSTTVDTSLSFGSVIFSGAKCPTNGLTVFVSSDYFNVKTSDFKTFTTFGITSDQVHTQFYDVKWFKDKFIFAGNNNGIFTADANLVQTTLRQDDNPLQRNISYVSIAVSDNIAVVVGYNSFDAALSVQTSTDGITWTERFSSISVSFRTATSDPSKIIYDGSKFLIVTSTGKIWTSTDGINWNTSATTIGSTIFYSGGIYFSTTQNTLYTSTDGVTWVTKTRVTANTSIYGIEAIGNLYFATSFLTDYVSSDGGTTWSVYYAHPNYSQHRCLYKLDSNKIISFGRDQAGKLAIVATEGRHSYGVNPATNTSTIAKNSPLTSVEFDSNIKTIDSGKLENSGHTAANIFYANASGNITPLTIGQSGNTLNVVSSLPVWSVMDQTKISIAEYKTAGSYTWTKPAGAKAVYAYIVGAGGGGAGGSMFSGNYADIVAAGGSGGGGGGVAELMLAATDVPSSATVVVGTGGSGGTGGYQLGNGNAATSGIAGGNSSFWNIRATGGGGGSTGLSWYSALTSSGTVSYASLGGKSGIIPFRGKYDIKELFAAVYDVETNVGVGGSSWFNVTHNQDMTLTYLISAVTYKGNGAGYAPGLELADLNYRNGKNGRFSPGGGAAGGFYLKLDNEVYSNTWTFGASGGSGFPITFLNGDTVRDVESVYNYDRSRVPLTYSSSRKSDVNGYASGANDDAVYSEGQTVNTSSGFRFGAGGGGGAFGGYTLSYSGSGGTGYWPGGGGGGAGGCFALSGISSRAGNGGRGADGYVLVITIF